MNLKYLLDTNIISESMRASPHPQVVNKLTINQLQICTATVVIHEFLYGCWRLPESKRRNFFQEYISDLILNVPIFNYDLKSAQYHAKERTRLSKIGKIPSFIDSQIASICCY
ncbi:PIN domain-containing protein [Okeania sp.]|uniref:PIN domain-containing protein n=1 Tax=Okeania sp. TaxID=3100323 RepID=UPI002B4B732D|nr:PIN domain-containing protein [Okeania sp.]MEB3343588.1 PIN domain-containing protein [Okeania sp.]